MVKGLGAYLPTKRVTNEDLAQRVATSDEWIHTRTGIRERRIAGPGEDTLTMALEASRQALSRAGLEPKDLDLIVLATITPAVPAPATACWLQDALGCRTIPAFDVSAACSGFVYAFIAGASLMATCGYQNVLVVGAEALSSVTDWDDRGTCILLGDGAGAAVLTPADNDKSGLYARKLGADGSGAELIWVPAGGSREPAATKTINERLHYLKMKGREVYRFAVTKMQEVVSQAVEDAGISIKDLALVVPHQSNLRIIESAADKLGLPLERVAINIDRCANTSAASIPMALEEAVSQGRVKRGDWVLLAGFGAGLTWGSALLRW